MCMKEGIVEDPVVRLAAYFEIRSEQFKSVKKRPTETPPAARRHKAKECKERNETSMQSYDYDSM